MSKDFRDELARLARLSVKQLRLRYEDLFREPTQVGNKQWLVKRIAWRLQEIAEGGLSERARGTRPCSFANDADLRLNPPRELLDEAKPKAHTPETIPLHAPAPAPERTKVVEAPTLACDDRLPPPGSIILRKYKGRTLQVKVLQSGFEHDGKVYPSLSAVAKAITGTHCNGFAFFKLNAKETSR